MKIRLLFSAAAFALLLQSASFAQQINLGRSTEDDSPCPNFPMPVTKPFVDERELLVMKPDDGVDFKMIIVNPCVSKTEESKSFSPLNVPQGNGNPLQSPAITLKFGGSGFTPPLKNNSPHNLLLVPG